MGHINLLKVSTALLLAAWTATNAQKTPYDYVDPLIGTANGGHVFPGASLPFGMAKAVADVNGEDQGGFASDNSGITGFSHMHDSGTGGSPSLGNFPLFPQAGCPNDDLNQCKFSKTARATPRMPNTTDARPGFFAITLNNSIRSEMTVSNHTALYRFTFPKPQAAGSNSTNSPLIIVDLTDLPNSRQQGTASVDPKTGRLTGNGTFQPSFGEGQYNLFFCADFNGASIRDTGTWTNEQASSQPKSVSVGTSPPAGAYTRFNAPTSNNQILARVGVSFIGVDQACSNAQKEIPTFNFNSTLKSAQSAWQKKLEVISINAKGVSDELQMVFWSGVYRANISPQDYTGENPLWKSSEPYYDSYYCIWDSFRSIHPFITLTDPVSQSLMVRSLIDIYRHEGKLPDCRMSLCKGFTQGGSNADVVLVDSYLKGINQGVDWNTGYEAIVSDAEIEPPNWDIEGRGGLNSWKKLRYIPIDDVDILGFGTHTRSVSRTVEYAYDDFCIAEMAQRLNRTADYQKYTGRSENWRNVFKTDQKSSINGIDTGFTGFLQPKYPNGTWAFQDPILCSPLLDFTGCYLNPQGHETYEGSCWLYTFFVPGDMASLITTLGGPQNFIDRLEYLHDSGLLYIGDEQGFLPVYQYHYGGRPALSAKRAHFYIPSQFNDTLVGIAGNDDSGAMGSFVALAMIGLFPNAGQDVYLITPPFFPEVSIKNGQTAKTATIRNENFDPAYKNIYIQSATLNGEIYTKNWIDHGFFLNGGVLTLVLGPEESKWGTGAGDLPPSLSTMAA